LRWRTVDRLLVLRGKLWQDLFFGAAEDEGANRPSEKRRLALGRSLPRSHEPPEHARIQELEKRPELAQVVLDRGSAQGDSALGAKEPARLRRLRLVVLDVLGFVENDRPELDVLQGRDIAPQYAVRREHDVDGAGIELRLRSLARGVIAHPKIGNEARGLLDPVVDEAPRHDHQRRLGSPFSSPKPFEKGEDLDRLPESHVVREAASETVLRQKPEPRQSLLLIGAELSAKPRRGLGGRNPLKRPKPLPQPDEAFVGTE